MTTQALKLAVLDDLTAALGGIVNRRCPTDLSGYDPMAWQNVTLPEGSVCLHYHEDRKGDYIHVSGDWPGPQGQTVNGRDVGGRNPEIRVSAAKLPAVAAADIRRRFLPEYVPLYEKATEVIASRNAYAATVADNFRLLAEACGGKAELSGGFNRDQWRIVGLPEGVTLKYVTDERVDLVLECTVGNACMILRGRAN